MNSGRQVSTQVSLGGGTIKIAEEVPEPEAVFVHGGQKVTPKMKADIETPCSKPRGMRFRWEFKKP